MDDEIRQTFERLNARIETMETARTQIDQSMTEAANRICQLEGMLKQINLKVTSLDNQLSAAGRYVAAVFTEGRLDAA